MADGIDSSERIQPPSRSRVIISEIQRKATNLSGDREIWALLWKTKCYRRETIVLICFLLSEGGRQLKDYRATIAKFKRWAEHEGCSCVADTLEVVKVKDPRIWWQQFFEDDQQFAINRYQMVHFCSNEFRFCSARIYDAEWSLVLHIMNNSSIIEEIIRSGNVPGRTPVEISKKLSPRNSVDKINRIATEKDLGLTKHLDGLFFLSFLQWAQKIISKNSMLFLHFRTSKATNLSSISMIRCWQASSPLWNYLSIRNEMTPSYSHSITQCLKLQQIPSQREERIDGWNAFLLALADTLLGIMLGTLLLSLVYNQPNLVTSTYIYIKKIAFQYLEDQISWLETFPAGFKLNVQLTHTMGHGIRSILNHHQGIMVVTIWDPGICRDYMVPTLAVIAALGGWTTFLAVLVDLWRLEIIHVTFLAACFRKLYQTELYLLSALFRLFRGKKRNALRCRTDSMKYDSMQLLVGTIAFCVCVFLWTTVMVYYTFFVIWNLLMHLPLMGCSVLYILGRSIPFGSLFFRFASPHLFPKDMYIEMKDDLKMNPEITIQVSELKSTLESPAFILASRIKVPLKRLFSWYMVSILEILYPSAGNKSHSFLPVSLLVEDAKN